MGRMVTLVAAAALTAGCSTTPPVPSSSPDPDPEPTLATGTPSPPVESQPTPPARTNAFPAPDELGAGWRYAKAPSDPEAGHVARNGNRRDPAEVIALAVPLGCPRATTMPPARAAYEVSYTFQTRAVVAIRLRFGDPGAAQGFVEARRENLESCLGLSGGPAVGPYVVHVQGALNDRTPESEPWTELVLRRDRSVLMLAAEGTLDEQPFSTTVRQHFLGAA